MVVETRRKLTLEELRARREEILRIAAGHGVRNVRVFGSVARGEADERSDVDLLVDVTADAGGFAYFGVLEDLRQALASAPIDTGSRVPATTGCSRICDRRSPAHYTRRWMS